ncbi:MAG: outer membrane protein assembly factor BamD [Tepidisphaeraceae bacterium]
MLRVCTAPLAALVVLFSMSVGVAQHHQQLAMVPQTWELRDGQWQPVSAEDAATRPASTDATLDRVEQLINANQNRGAFKLVVRWFKSHEKTDSLYDRALFLAARSLHGIGNRLKAFYYLDELMDTYPASPLFYPSLEMQYEIANAYLNGYKRRFALIPFLDARDEAVEMLYRIQQRSPGSPLAEKALLRTADYYFATSQFDLAGDAYGSYAKAYPRSPVVGRVMLRQGFSSLAQFRGVKFDATSLVNARAQLEDVEFAHAELAAEENVPTVIDRIDETFAKKLFYTADFYQRTSEPRAAVYTYRFLIKAYPDSAEAGRAQKRLERLPAWALNEPEPASGTGYLPTTMPTQAVEPR